MDLFYDNALVKKLPSFLWCEKIPVCLISNFAAALVQIILIEVEPFKVLLWFMVNLVSHTKGIVLSLATLASKNVRFIQNQNFLV